VIRAVISSAILNGGREPRSNVRLRHLTQRESEILRLIAQGLSNIEIADHLVVSEATVKTHIGHLFAKLDVRDRVQAVILAYDNGIVEADVE
jgi:DNA-binding NarL/FixJ family response regulator